MVVSCSNLWTTYIQEFIHRRTILKAHSEARRENRRFPSPASPSQGGSGGIPAAGGHPLLLLVLSLPPKRAAESLRRREESGSGVLFLSAQAFFPESSWRQRPVGGRWIRLRRRCFRRPHCRIWPPPASDGRQWIAEHGALAANRGVAARLAGVKPARLA
ncbi:hypothetical protein GQ55_6G002900 [Panicum hallii var. hallii]|uniref:Uncharacterized protein n=1 Tax=Panicum hallii var. hallii TaxID=1504633 RepID=A0A2T7D2A4_9POAL|nr:hypothetical protein GQ55_6G002900 [Panicum hallii var. hallii]